MKGQNYKDFDVKMYFQEDMAVLMPGLVVLYDLVLLKIVENMQKQTMLFTLNVNESAFICTMMSPAEFKF